MRTDFDSPWKMMLTNYFDSCLAFYFPEAHRQIDWHVQPTFLDKELNKLLPKDQSRPLRVDKLAQIKLHTGEEGRVLVHIEVQSQREQSFAERLYRYNSRLYSSRRTKVATLAILCDSAPSWRPTQFAYDLLGCHVQLDFPTAKLLDYQTEADKLAESDNPFAIVTLAHLDALATKADDPARKTAKFRLVRLLYDRGYEREDVANLFRFIDWVLWLDPELEEQFEEEVEAFEKERNMEYISTLERKAIEQGLEQGVLQGRDEGVVLGQQKMLLMLMSQKFGPLSPEVVAQVEAIQDESVLQALVQRILTAVSLADMQIPSQE